MNILKRIIGFFIEFDHTKQNLSKNVKPVTPSMPYPSAQVMAQKPKVSKVYRPTLPSAYEPQTSNIKSPHNVVESVNKPSCQNDIANMQAVYAAMIVLSQQQSSISTEESLITGNGGTFDGGGASGTFNDDSSTNNGSSLSISNSASNSSTDDSSSNNSSSYSSSDDSSSYSSSSDSSSSSF